MGHFYTFTLLNLQRFLFRRPRLFPPMPFPPYINTSISALDDRNTQTMPKYTTEKHNCGLGPRHKLHHLGIRNLLFRRRLLLFTHPRNQQVRCDKQGRLD